MYYIFYLSNIIRLYLFIRYFYGIYISYYFLKSSLYCINSTYVYLLSKLYKPSEQINDKYIHIEFIDDYILIS